MVCKVSELAHNDEELLKEMLRSIPYRDCSQFEDDIINRYHFYDEVGGNPEQVEKNEYEKSVHDRLYSLYDSRKEIVVNLKQNIRELAGGYCPMCGLGTMSTTVEHYLPRSEYPELSLFSKNLIPACSRCNTQKRTTVLSEENRKVFLNSYYDKICAQQIIELQYTGTMQEPKGAVIPYHGLEGEDNALVQRHIDQLKMNKAYASYLPKHYKRLWKELRDIAKVMSEDQIRLVVSARIASGVSEFGPNYYEVLLLQSVVQTGFFEEMLVTDVP